MANRKAFLQAEHEALDANIVVALAIAAGAVTQAKIADDAVDATKLRDDAVTDANRAVTTDHIRDLAITNGKIKKAGETYDFTGVTALRVPQTGSNDNDAASKAYVDAAAAGARDIKDSVRVATTAALPANTYSSATKRLTASANGALAAQDGITLVVGDRILVKNEATGSNNGIYKVIQTGDAVTPYILERTTDADSSAEVTTGMYVWSSEGTVNADRGWMLTTNDPITLDTTALTFTQVSGLGQVTAGAGLTKTGDTIDVVVGQGLSAGADQVDLVLDGVTLTKGAAGLKVSTNGITPTELAAANAGPGLTGGGGSPLQIGLPAGSGLIVNADDIQVDFAETVDMSTADNTNNAGTNAECARGDHRHAHGDLAGGTLHAAVIAGGAAGFMSGADKTKLDALGDTRNVTGQSISTTAVDIVLVASADFPQTAMRDVFVRVAGLKTDGVKGASYHLSGSFRRPSVGAPVLVGGNFTTNHSAEDDVAWNAELLVVVNDVVLRVTGEATVDWRGRAIICER